MDKDEAEKQATLWLNENESEIRKILDDLLMATVVYGEKYAKQIINYEERINNLKSTK